LIAVGFSDQKGAISPLDTSLPVS